MGVLLLSCARLSLIQVSL